MARDRKGFVYPSRERAYRGIRRDGETRHESAAIANAGKTHAQRVRMAKKAARTRTRKVRR